MKQHFARIALLAPLAFALTGVQSILGTGSIISVPALPTHASVIPTFCGNSTTVCPACDQKCITNPTGSKYRVHCDAYFVSNITRAQPGRPTPEECMQACDETKGCLGVLTLPNGVCELATGASLDTFAQTNYTVYIVETVALSSTESVASSTQTHEVPSVSTITIMSDSSSYNTKICHASKIQCPGCHNQTVTDHTGKEYRVYCDSRVFADADFVIPHQISPDSCLTYCDNSTSCRGATYWPEGNCQLAQGHDAMPQQMPGYTAFMPLGFKPSISASTVQPRGYTTTGMPNETASTTTDMVATTPSYGWGPYPTAANGTCNASAATCPACEATILVDNANNTYLIQCDAKPVCSRTVNVPGYMPQEACLQRCDDDAACLLAIFDRGKCELCDDSIGDDATGKGSNDTFIVFLLESPRDNDNSYVSGQNSTMGPPGYANGSATSTSALYGTASSQLVNATAIPQEAA